MWGKKRKQKINNEADSLQVTKPYDEEVGNIEQDEDTIFDPYAGPEKTWDEEMGEIDQDLPSQTMPQDLAVPQKKKEKSVRSFEAMFTAKENKKVRTNVYMVSTVVPVLIVFALLILYIVRFMLYDSQAVISSPYNKRTSKIQEKVRRGKIFSANDKVLAETIRVDGTDVRSYPYENMFAQVVGYSKHGKGGLEAEFNYNLLVSHTDVMSQIKNGLVDSKMDGDSLYTTLDTRLQKAAYEAMDGYRGAVVVIEPKTGNVRAMLSKPDFDPNTLDENWDEISQDSESGRLMNRCIQGLYPPGSVYKTITALEYIEEHPNDYGDFTYNCEGSDIVNSVKIKCYHDQHHGEEDLEKAFAKSCNTAFVNLGCSLNLSKFIALNKTCLFNEKIDFTLPVKKSRFALTKKSKDSELPQTVIGQGNTLVTPMHMALLMCAIANKGTLMKPTLFDRIESVEGKVIKEYKADEYKELMSVQKAMILQKLLRAVVTDGSGAALNTDEYTAVGKTGTAENEKERPHSWFVGYANMDDPDIVVCVIVENQGAGSEYATPIAREIFDSYYGNELNSEY